MEVKTIIETAKAYKADGNEFFKACNYKKTLFKYHLSLNELKVVRVPGQKATEADTMAAMVGSGGPIANNTEDLDDINQLKRTIHLNMANCYCKEEKYRKAIEAASRSIDIEPTAKAFYRRAMAWIGREDYDEAMSDLKEAAALDPTDRAVKAEMDVVEKKKKAEAVRQRKQLAGMFG
ncbi:hypothetical protein FOL47_008540 [Perkinsus chesapeaki]|uniref:peptidylprolyl isomerase n=1 Tax=Perkinsus chesapeaki TaxID=330153 RepID=A0A7J6LDQ9_PERCH|nr:hypothetical protein FOL47_008540 [Perkinsus chesapeaki]